MDKNTSLEGLTRYEPSPKHGGMIERPKGSFLSFLEVERLLATTAGEQAESSQAFPERDPSKPAEQQGIFHKFDIRRVDGSDQPGGKHYGCRYFVLDLTHDEHAPAAMRAYAAACSATHPQLASDIEAEFGAAPATPEQVQPKPAHDNARRKALTDAIEEISRVGCEWIDNSNRDAAAPLLNEAIARVRKLLASPSAAAPAAPSGFHLPKGWRQYVARAYVEWRKHDQSTPDDVLDLMRDILYAAEEQVVTAPAAPEQDEVLFDLRDAILDALSRKAAPHAWESLVSETAYRFITERRAMKTATNEGDARDE